MIGGVALLRRPRLLAAAVVAALVWCGIGAERASASTQTYTTAGSYSFTVPAGVTSVAVTAIGGAGGAVTASWSLPGAKARRVRPRWRSRRASNWLYGWLEPAPLAMPAVVAA